MTASSAVVLSNLAYLIGAVVLATLGGVIVWWRQRQPQSVHANVESFHRGLQALAPATARSGSNQGTRLRIEPETGPRDQGALTDEPESDQPEIDQPEIDQPETDQADIDEADIDEAEPERHVAGRAGVEAG